jgi:hypothetical protein
MTRVLGPQATKSTENKRGGYYKWLDSSQYPPGYRNDGVERQHLNAKFNLQLRGKTERRTQDHGQYRYTDSYAQITNN